MTSISRTLSALAAGALLASVAGTAQAQTPYSSYSSPARDIPASCRNVELLADGYVSAECRAEGGWRWSALRPTDCRTSISNRDGVLTCTGARATVGALYPDNDGYGGQATTQQPGGIIGALFGTVFGNAYSNDRQIEDDYSNGRLPLGGQRVTFNNRVDAALRDRRISRTAANRLRTAGPVPGLAFAGDWVRIPTPAALMEGAVTSGIDAANEIGRLHGLAPHENWSVPTRGILTRVMG